MHSPGVRTQRRAMHGIYMDYQASTPLDPRALAAMMPFLTGGFGNPHAVDHGYGWEADGAIAQARSQVATLIGADADEIIFTSGATEANNLALLGTASAAPPDRRRIIVSAIEHKCVLAAGRALAGRGYEVVTIPVSPQGLIDLDALGAAIDSRTALVSVMAVNNEIGTVQPMQEIAALCRAAGTLFHSDCAQGIAALEVDVSRWGVDLLSLSAHKAYGPKGIGALYVCREARPRLRPIMYGGGQEEGLRPGTLPTALCVGFGAACTILKQERETENQRIGGLRDRLLEGLKLLTPSFCVNGTMAGRHPGNLNLRFPGAEAEMVLGAARPALAAATSAACTSGTPEPSHVLRALGLSADAAHESIRLSIGRFTTEQEVDEAAHILASAVEQVRAVDFGPDVRSNIHDSASQPEAAE